MTDRNLLRAQLLIEAADLLNEAEARDTRIAQNHALKKLKKDYKDYFKGRLSKEEGEKAYKELKTAIEQLKTICQKIPKETAGEKILAVLRDEFTVRGASQRFIASFIGGNIPMTPVSIGLTMYNSKTKSGEMNWNKAYLERRIAAVEKLVEKAYNKYYKNYAQPDESDTNQEPTVESILNY